jgi:hypothetical protein
VSTGIDPSEFSTPIIRERRMKLPDKDLIGGALAPV